MFHYLSAQFNLQPQLFLLPRLRLLISHFQSPLQEPQLSQTSPGPTTLLMLLVVLRLGMRAGIGFEGATLHANGRLLTDLSIVFTALLFSVRGLEIFLRARRLMKTTP